MKLYGADPDSQRRDLFDAIAAGDFPEFEFSVQAFDEKTAAKFPFDILDSTKLIPEEMVPLEPIGRMVLDRNPDNFFAETEQVVSPGQSPRHRFYGRPAAPGAALHTPNATDTPRAARLSRDSSDRRSVRCRN